MILCDKQPKQRQLGSVGHAVKGAELAIVDAATGRPVAEGGEGEVRKKRPFFCSYLSACHGGANVTSAALLQLLGSQHTHTHTYICMRVQVWASGPMVFQGYHNKPEETEAAFGLLGGKRWFRTGDLGTLTKEGILTVSSDNDGSMPCHLGFFPRPRSDVARQNPGRSRF